MTLNAYNKLFEDIMNEFHGTYVGSENYATYFTKENYHIEVVLTGVSKEELEVKVEDNRLNILTKPTKASRFVKGTSLAFLLRDDADVNNVVAKLENGLLLVTIPKIKPEKKLVNVTVN